MDEVTYLKLADRWLRALQDGIDALDADLCDCDRAGDVVTITFASGLRCVVNTQRPTRQLWVAARTSAWHFVYDASKSNWFDEKQSSRTLFAALTEVVQNEAKVTPRFVEPAT
jgi:CyaY protein